MALLSSAELNKIKADINGIVTDTSIGTIVKYRQFTGKAFTPTAQVIPLIYIDWSGVSTIKGLLTKDERGEESQLGDTKFIIMQSSVSNALGVSDLIVESGTTYNVKQINADPLGIVYTIMGERVK